MAIVVVGGQTRNIGKTSVVAGLIHALPELQWTAFKITQFGHGICSANGKPCACETGPHTIAISEERDRQSGTDSARYLAAGAAHSFWVRTRQGQLREAMPRVQRELGRAQHAIFESNSILEFLTHDLYLSVLDPSVPDFKVSARHYLDRADAILLAGDLAGQRARVPANARLFQLQPPDYVTGEIVAFVAERLAAPVV
jgi:hypothetical protein